MLYTRIILCKRDFCVYNDSILFHEIFFFFFFGQIFFSTKNFSVLLAAMGLFLEANVDS